MKMFYHSVELINNFSNNFTGVIPKLPVPADERIVDVSMEIMNAFTSDTNKQQNTSASVEKWQDIFAQMNAKPKYLSSITSLLKCFNDKGELWKICPIVDFYNWVSLAEGIPMAGYDAEKISQKVELRYAQKGELFTPLGNPNQKEKTKSGEVVYTDEEKIICRYWNLKDCDESKITTSTREVCFFFDLYNDNADQAKNVVQAIINKWFKVLWPDVSFGITGKGLTECLDF